LAVTACLWANSLNYPNAGGHRWVYLNWALGLRACGLKVIWLESVAGGIAEKEIQGLLATLKYHLRPYGLADSIALCPIDGHPLPISLLRDAVHVDDAAESDLLIDLAYADSGQAVRKFKLSVLIDIDPGLTQLWIQSGGMSIAPHDFYFTIGETVGRADSGFPDCGLKWIYVPPCIALEWWPLTRVSGNSPLSTVANWWGEWMSANGVSYDNSKRVAFLPYLDLPKFCNTRLELAIGGKLDEDERDDLEKRGWSIRNAWEVASTPWDYQRYIQNARGEFSCAKPSCSRLKNAWLSDRTLCYLASGRPAVVEHTGRSRFLPDAEGLFRFKSLEEALLGIRELELDYEQHSWAARALAERYFDAKMVVSRLLDQVL
jgi:hypothetical protein